MASNDPPIPPDKVLGFNTRSEAEDYMSTHPDGCLGAVTFVAQGASGSFSYIVTSNSTVRPGGIAPHARAGRLLCGCGDSVLCSP